MENDNSLFSGGDDGPAVIGRNYMATIQNYTLTSPMNHQPNALLGTLDLVPGNQNRHKANRTSLFSPLANQKNPIPTPSIGSAAGR